jgi:2-(1,2-epoxy-1,2-dihydrophenyl)acetyl-CoA isomerase
MGYEMVIWEVDDGVGRLTLNRPDTLNAWTAEFGEELKAVIENEAADESVRSVLVTGAGRGFSSGADLKTGFEPHPDDGMPDVRKELHEVYHPVIAGVRRLPKPVVAAVNGPALGGGFALALLCDVRLAASSATFGFPGLAFGIPASYGAARAVLGPAAARELAFTGRTIDAEEARTLGIVSEVMASDGLRAAAMAFADRIARAPRWAVLETKRRVLLDAERTWQPLLDDELRALEEALLRPQPDPAA